MIRIDVEFRTNGDYIATHGELHAPNARALARKLVEAGTPDQPVEGGRPGKRDWTVRSLHALAATALVEGDRGFQVQTYRPYPPRPLHPALQRAVAARAEAIKNRREGGGTRGNTPGTEKQPHHLQETGG